MTAVLVILNVALIATAPYFARPHVETVPLQQRGPK